MPNVKRDRDDIGFVLLHCASITCQISTEALSLHEKTAVQECASLLLRRMYPLLIQMSKQADSVLKY